MQNSWPVSFKSVKIMKVKMRLRNCSRLKESKRTKNSVQLLNPELDLFARNDITG